MSLKQSTSKPDPRIAKREVMVTRHKSAQMKRQLRTKNRSMKHITDLLKSPAKETHPNTPKNVSPKTKSPLKLKQSLLKSVEKVQKLPEKDFKLSKVLRKKSVVVHDEEYFPNKRKRKVDVKKVSLKPSNELQMVGGITGSVKRKYAVPHKVTSNLNSPKLSQLVYSELSMDEVIRLVEDDLTDEDLMEILTCPSPVWWEDPPDEDYIEDALFTRSPLQPPSGGNRRLEFVKALERPEVPIVVQEKMEVDVPPIVESSLTEQTIVIPNLNTKSDKFLKKRSKLEGLLGNIKNKRNIHVNHSKKNVISEDLVVLCSNYRKDNSYSGKVNNSIKDSVNNDNKTNDNTKITIREEVRKETVSESDGDEIIFQDNSMTEDDMLKDLENITIPIEDDKKQSDVIIINDDDYLDTASKNGKRYNFKLKTSTNDKNMIPQVLPVLQKCDQKQKFIDSPKSFDSSTSKTSASPSHDIDSISDTNVRFLLDDEVAEENKNKVSDFFKTSQGNDLNKDTQKTSKDTSSNSMTIYKIIGDVDDAQANDIKSKIIEIKKEKDINDDKSAVKMNDYYKKCKKVYQKRHKNVDRTDVNKNDVSNVRVKLEDDTAFMLCASCKPKSRKVSSNDKNVYVCLSCSSISETVDCAYCIENSKSKGYICVLCEMKFCCEVYYKKHAIEHRELDLMT